VAGKKDIRLAVNVAPLATDSRHMFVRNRLDNFLESDFWTIEPFRCDKLLENQEQS
jgi:hypothetical protein